MNGDIMLSFTVVFQTHFLLAVIMISQSLTPE